MLDGVLRGKHHERRLHGVRRAVDRGLTFFHDLEQRRLRFGGRAVDLVDEDDLREDGAGVELKVALARTKDACAEHVGGHEVWCELHARVVQACGLGEKLGGERFGHARHPLDKRVTSGEQARDKLVHHADLTDDEPPNLVPAAFSTASATEPRSAVGANKSSPEAPAGCAPAGCGSGVGACIAMESEAATCGVASGGRGALGSGVSTWV